jgi:virulence-associated protein VapD
MELDRKAFHFDLDNESVERFYTGKKNPWSDIQDFLESHCFEKPQYSGYESAENIVMSYQRAYGTIDEMMNEFPWFKDSLLAASVTEVGERHDALSYIKGSHGIIVPVPAHSLEREEPDFFGSEIGDMKSATAELSKRNGLEPPKDLNRAH